MPSCTSNRKTRWRPFFLGTILQSSASARAAWASRGPRYRGEITIEKLKRSRETRLTRSAWGEPADKIYKHPSLWSIDIRFPPPSFVRDSSPLSSDSPSARESAVRPPRNGRCRRISQAPWRVTATGVQLLEETQEAFSVYRAWNARGGGEGKFKEKRRRRPPRLEWAAARLRGK